MQILTRSASIRDRVRIWRAAGQRVALVPTAGALHKGHMSLVAEAQERADRVIVSLFSDLPQANTPTLEADRELLHNIGADLVFAPPAQEMFPFGRANSSLVVLPSLNGVLEGAADLKSLADATTLLIKLLNIVKPDLAAFGERDYQQLVMIRRLVDDLFMTVDIVGCATFRDGDGLAFATDNHDLSAEQRLLAPRLYETLRQIGARIDAGEQDFKALERDGVGALESAGFALEYFVICQAMDLAPVTAGCRDLIILAAVRLDGVRLKDNLRVHVIDRF